MVGNIKRTLVETKYRMKIRTTLQQATIEEIKITKGIEKWNVKAGVVFEDRKFSKLNNFSQLMFNLS